MQPLGQLRDGVSRPIPRPVSPLRRNHGRQLGQRTSTGVTIHAGHYCTKLHSTSPLFDKSDHVIRAKTNIKVAQMPSSEATGPHLLRNSRVPSQVTRPSSPSISHPDIKHVVFKVLHSACPFPGTCPPNRRHHLA